MSSLVETIVSKTASMNQEESFGNAVSHSGKASAQAFANVSVVDAAGRKQSISKNGIPLTTEGNGVRINALQELLIAQAKKTETGKLVLKAEIELNISVSGEDIDLNNVVFEAL